MATMTRQQFLFIELYIPQNFVSPQGTIKAAGNMTFDVLTKITARLFLEDEKRGVRKYFREIW
jgi:hypothetical protein